MKTGAIVLLLLASRASATKFAQPERHRVYSQSGAFFLDVNPETDINTVFATGDGERALWSFSKPVWHYPFLVSNDGQVVATVPWRFITAQQLYSGTGIEIWSRQGVLRTYPVVELCPEPTKTTGPGPIGDQWRTWSTGVEDHGTSFTVHTTCGTVHEFGYSTVDVVTRREPQPRRPLWILAVVLGCVLAALMMIRRHRRPPHPASQPTPPSRRG